MPLFAYGINRFSHDVAHFQACIVLTLWDNSPDSEVPTLSQKYQCMVYYGNALYTLAEYTKAEVNKCMIFRIIVKLT